MVGCCDSQRINLDLHIIHIGYRTGAHIDDHRTFDYSVHFEHCFVDCSRYFAQLRSSDRLPANFVDFLGLGGSRRWYDF